MSLNFKRAVEHGGILEHAKSAQCASGNAEAYAFLASPGVAVSIASLTGGKSFAGEVTSPPPYSSYSSTPVLVADHDEGQYLIARARLEDGRLRLEILHTDHDEIEGHFGGGAGEALHHSVKDILDDTIRRRENSLSPTFSSRALNRSALEAFVWADMIKQAGEHGKVENIYLRVRPEVIIDDTMAADGEDLPPLEIEFSLDEAPGIPWGVYFMNEYNDAKNARKGKGLKLRDVCGKARKSTCLGGEDECGYDDYVFARATGRCKGCATQSSVRNKFKVKD